MKLRGDELVHRVVDHREVLGHAQDGVVGPLDDQEPPALVGAGRALGVGLAVAILQLAD